MKSSVALIGFMGTGKTAVGRALAKELGKEFIEMDPLIEQKAGKTIPEIFKRDGEIAFRELEIAVAKDISGKKNVVIACGGGVVLNKINIDRLKEAAVVICLNASPDIILKRISACSEVRPLLKVADPGRAIRDLLEFRQPFYKSAADISLDTSGLDIQGVVRLIMRELGKYEDFNL